MYSLLKAQQGVSPNVIPGFRLTLTFTLAYLLILVIIPLSGLFLKTATLSLPDLVTILTSSRVLAAFKLSFTSSLIAAVINTLFGLIVAWVLVRYDFPFKKILDAFVDLPFALPTAVAGIALTAIYSSKGWIGKLFQPFGIKIAYTPIGITIALILVGLPFVVRNVQPVLQDMSKEPEEVAACLGATRFQTFYKIILPHILPSLLTGFAMAFARALGEYGSVIFIAGNIPKFTEIIPLVIVIQLEQYDYASACAIASLMLVVSFSILLLINFIQRWSDKKEFR